MFYCKNPGLQSLCVSYSVLLYYNPKFLFGQSIEWGGLTLNKFCNILLARALTACNECCGLCAPQGLQKPNIHSYYAILMLLTKVSVAVHENKRQLVYIAVYLACAAAPLRKSVYRLVHLDEQLFYFFGTQKL